MRLAKYIIKDKFLSIKADIRDLLECICDCMKTTKEFNKELNKLYSSMIKLRYYSFKIKHCKENLIKYDKILLHSDLIWNITNYHEQHYINYDERVEASNKAINVSLGKNNNKIYKVYYTMNMSDEETEYCKEIKGHANMIMWCNINQEEDIISVTRIEL